MSLLPVLQSLLQAHFLTRISEAERAVAVVEAVACEGVSEACPVGLQPHHEQVGILTAGA